MVFPSARRSQQDFRLAAKLFLMVLIFLTYYIAGCCSFKNRVWHGIR
jgi:hypothetical protein